jgi:hypothetical protein
VFGSEWYFAAASRRLWRIDVVTTRLRVIALVDVVTGVVVVVVGVAVDPQADSTHALAMIAGTTTRDRCIGVELLSDADTRATGPN